MDTRINNKLVEEENQDKKRRRFEQYQQRFDKKNLCWYERNQSKKIIALVISYVANIASILGLGYTVVIIMQSFGVHNEYIAWALAVPFMALFEYIKRYFSDAFWDFYHSSIDKAKQTIDRISWPNFLINFILIFGLSLAGSVGGIYWFAKEKGPEAKYIGLSSDPNASALLTEVEEKKAAYDQFIKDPGNHNSKGEFYYKLLGQKNKMLDEIQEKEKLLNSQYGIIAIDNKEIKADWKTKTKFRIIAALLITIFFEIIFEVCMSFLSRFDYEEYKYLLASGDLTKVKPERIINLASDIQNGARKVQTDYSHTGTHTQRTQIGFGNTHTDTHKPVSRVARDTQPATHTDTQNRVSHTQSTHIMKSAKYYDKMERRIRERFARSHKDHPRAPKSGSSRKNLYDDAMMEWEEMQSVGYKISVNPDNKFKLIIEAPKNIEYVES